MVHACKETQISETPEICGEGSTRRTVDEPASQDEGRGKDYAEDDTSDHPGCGPS